jgi:hypothetical protein
MQNLFCFLAAFYFSDFFGELEMREKKNKSKKKEERENEKVVLFLCFGLFIYLFINLPELLSEKVARVNVDNK